MQHIFGFGKVRIEKNDQVVTLEYSSGHMFFEDSNVDIQCLNGTVARFYEGSRPKITLTIRNLGNETTALLRLMRMLNAARTDNQGVLVYPNYINATSMCYQCHFGGTFDPKTISEIEAGQKFDLDFTGVDWVTSVKPYINNLELSVLEDSNHDIIVDHNNETIDTLTY